MSLITSHDYLNIHKIMGFGCLIHYGYRFSLKILYNDMYLTPNIYPLFHLCDVCFCASKCLIAEG